MDDTISRQAAVDALDGEITVTVRANAEAVRGYANLVADRLKRLPSAQPKILACGEGELIAQPEQRWIPVTERLPKENKPVLVTHYGKYQAFVSVDWIDPYTSEWNRTCNVTAWQPLPKPWKGENNERS